MVIKLQTWCGRFWFIFQHSQLCNLQFPVRLTTIKVYLTCALDLIGFSRGEEVISPMWARHVCVCRFARMISLRPRSGGGLPSRLISAGTRDISSAARTRQRESARIARTCRWEILTSQRCDVRHVEQHSATSMEARMWARVARSTRKLQQTVRCLHISLCRGTEAGRGGGGGGGCCVFGT